MQEEQQWLDWLSHLLQQGREILVAPVFLAQLTIIALSMLFGWWVSRRLDALLSRYLRPEASTARRLTHEGLVRVGPLLAVLAIMSVGMGVMREIGLATPLLDLAWLLTGTLLLIRTAVFVLRVALGPESKLRAWESTVSIVLWTALALHLLGWLEPTIHTLDQLGVETTQGTRISVWFALKLLVTVGVFVVVAQWIANAIERRVMKSQTLAVQMRVGISKVTHTVIIVLAVLLGLNTAGIDLTVLTVFTGAIGIGLGFGLQRIASNFVSGFVLIMDRSIRPGDVVSVGDSFGWVKELRGRYVVVRDRDGVERLIPNENLITSEVINWSYTDPKVRLKVPVQISYKDDPEQALKILLQAGEDHERVLNDPPPAARLMRFADSGIDLELRVWIIDPQRGVNNVRSDLNRSIWRLFKEHGITIPYPQRDVHVRPGVPAREEVTSNE